MTKGSLTGLLAAVLVGALTGCSTPASAPPAAKGSSSASPHAGGPPAGGPARAARPHRLRVRALPWRLPRRLARESAVRLPGHRVLVAGGLLSDQVSTSSTYTLDLRSGRAAPQPPLPVPVHDTAGVALGRHVLVVGGGNASEQAVVQARVHGRWRVLGRLPSPRSDLAAAGVRHCAYVVGGYDGTTAAVPDVLASRNGRRWSVVARLPTPVRYPATAAVGHTLWVFGGERNGSMVDAVQRVDLATGRAQVVGHTPRPVGHQAAIVFGGRVLLAGGRPSAGTVTARMWWFSPRSRRFTRAGRLPAPRADTAVVQAPGGGGTAYLIGGESPAFSDRVLELRWR